MPVVGKNTPVNTAFLLLLSCFPYTMLYYILPENLRKTYSILI